MPEAPHLGTAIKRARERKRWTQRQLADAIGVDTKSISNWELDKTQPKSSIGALEDVLGVSLSDPVPAPGPVPRDEWEEWVLSDPNIPDYWRGELIAWWRASRAAGRHARHPAAPEGERRQAG